MPVTLSSCRKWLALLSLAIIPAVAFADEGGRSLGDAFRGQKSRAGLREPVLRVAEVPARSTADAPAAIAPAAAAAPATPAQPTSTPNPAVAAPQAPAHPLDPVLEMARRGLTEMDRNIKDYTTTMVKRERINGKLGEHQYVFMKVRNEPLSVYMYFLGPDKIRGQEVVYVAGKNLKDGKAQLCGHGVGIRGIVPRMWLDPDSALAMDGQKYPITKVGIRNLTQELIDVGEKDKKSGDETEVKFFKGAKVQDRTCTCLQVVHPKKAPHLRFYLARVYIDDEYQIPIRYESHLWPTEPGGNPILEEEYTYMKLKLNAGLKDSDFDPDNPNYKFR